MIHTYGKENGNLGQKQNQMQILGCVEEEKKTNKTKQQCE